MKTTTLFRVVAMLVLAIASALSASAEGVLTVVKTYDATDGNFNFKCFDVDVPAEGSYYANFWLCPAKHKDGSYTNYGVYVNAQFVGKITPVAGKWQSVTVDGNAKLELTNGINTIIIATPADELPDVETIQIAASESDAKIDSDGYEKYFSEAQAGAMYENSSDDEGIAPFASSTGTIFRTGLKLGYSFYKVVHLQKGEEAPSIMTKSKTPHVLDVVLIGTPSSSYHKPESKPAPNYDNKNFYPDIVNPDDWQIDTTKTEFDQPFKWVRPYVMEMYNWSKTARSSGSYYKASLDVELPYDAYCLVRVRTQEEGVLGMLNEVSIIDDYKGLDFEDEPICFTKAKCELPGDSVTTYLTMTNCYDPETDDPMLFMHRADGNIVGFNDNGNVNVIYDFTKWFNLSNRDAVLTQSYKASTGYVSVCSKKTLETYSKCSILSGLDAYEELAAIINNKNKAPKKDGEVVKTVTISKAVGISSDIEISSESGNVGSVKAYDVFGNFVGSAKSNGSEANIPVSSLNIYRGGIYIIAVETPSGIQTERIVVR